MEIEVGVGVAVGVDAGVAVGVTVSVGVDVGAGAVGVDVGAGGCVAGVGVGVLLVRWASRVVVAFDDNVVDDCVKRLAAWAGVPEPKNQTRSRIPTPKRL